MSQESESNIFDSLPSDVDTDTPCLPENNINSLGQQHIPSVYTPQHQLVIGNGNMSSIFAAPHQRSSLDRSKDEDIVPVPHPYEGYKIEFKRLETFNDWPLSSVVRREDLARNGFIFLHIADRTQCVFCRGVLSNWESGDVVADEHKRNCPECPFVHGYACGNVPINIPGFQNSSHQSVIRNPQNPPYSFTRPLPRQQPAVYQTNVQIPVQNLTRPHVPTRAVMPNTSSGNLNIYGGNVTLTSNPATGAIIATNTEDAKCSLPPIPASGPASVPGSTNLPTTLQPKYPEWKGEDIRLRSFTNWPTQISQTPRSLARAGLLYMGAGDRAKCYWCGGELYDWEPEDDPMEEHAKWFTHCGYVRMAKGDAYIQYVKDKQNGLDSAVPSQEDVFAHPHVLAVIQSGFSHEQVNAAFNKYGADRLRDATSIVHAIEQIRRDSGTCSRPSAPVPCFPTSDNDVTMEDVESHGNTQNKNPSVNTQVSFTQQTFPKHAELTGTQVVPGGSEAKSSTPVKADNQPPRSSAAGLANQHSGKPKDRDTVLMENEKLRDMKLCKICLDNELNITFVPCGHMATCEDCARNLAECPICRNPISQAMKVYWS